MSIFPYWPAYVGHHSVFRSAGFDLILCFGFGLQRNNVVVRRIDAGFWVVAAKATAIRIFTFSIFF